MLTVKNSPPNSPSPRHPASASNAGVCALRSRQPNRPLSPDKLLASARSLTDQAEIDDMHAGIVAKLNAEAAAVQPLFERIRH